MSAVSAPGWGGRPWVKRRRPNPVLVGWRWRYELVLGAWLVIAGIGLGQWWVLGQLLLVAALLLHPDIRRIARTRAYCVIDQHRVRTACAQSWLTNRSGRLPAVLWTCPTEHGERVRVWCPAGITPADLHDLREQLAAACWAREVVVSRSVTHSQVAYLDVVRKE